MKIPWDELRPVEGDGWQQLDKKLNRAIDILTAIQSASDRLAIEAATRTLAEKQNMLDDLLARETFKTMPLNDASYIMNAVHKRSAQLLLIIRAFNENRLFDQLGITPDQSDLPGVLSDRGYDDD